MTVAGVFAVANVGYHEKVRDIPFDGSDGLLHDTVFVVGSGGLFILAGRNSEENYPADAEGTHFPAFCDDAIDGKLRVSGHGANLLAHALAVTGKKRQNELRRLKVRLAHERAKGFAGTQATHSTDGERHSSIVEGRLAGRINLYAALDGLQQIYALACSVPAEQDKVRAVAWREASNASADSSNASGVSGSHGNSFC